MRVLGRLLASILAIGLLPEAALGQLDQLRFTLLGIRLDEKVS